MEKRVNSKSVYIHIPFCSSICSYCDFCKMYYDKKIVNNYLLELSYEIEKNYKNEKVKTIYIGGGTPSCLSLDELEYLFKIIKVFKLETQYEFTIEMNINDITEEKLQLLKLHGINRISIGIETFNSKHLDFLNRNQSKNEVLEKINLTKKFFSNINVDLMYAFPNETLEDLNDDLKLIEKLNVNHISIYSLIIEEHTKIYIEKVKPISEDLERNMYYNIIEKLEKMGYKHYEISNFAKENYESKHNLVYWNNEEYYGFGLGASGYIDNKRYTNTRSINKYLTGNYTLEVCLVDKKIKMENHMILGLRKIEGVNKEEFKRLYTSNIEDIFDIISLVEKKLIIDDVTHIKIPQNMLYTSNNILVNFIEGGMNE